ncbi:Nucleoside-diphosphate-sugar epimerase [Palleronia marisminoris]|uniref:UDP-glucose 4-epimerase n=1 Tax=Palleronia marisminoris TaxID=315423 RepID=A0A1Y5T559_9RHOB|nr:NAD(P)-dependent oxidoreductase [Palleronia marisminoris]SFH14495.1 Nucleoside-diphosphate-sugar epimerase [Palleronia marisminoris]SLN54363.1 UDP-glucose 4-epimerase [Palleronia marisminoris]
MRILFTGGSGKAGRHVVPYLIEQGHEVTNLDLVPLDVAGVKNLTGDLIEPVTVWNALTQPADFDELEGGNGVRPYDAVVHFAAIPRIMITSDNETFRTNTMSTYNVIEAAVGLGVRKIIFASSETTYGICFADGERKPEYIPVDEEHPTIPGDSYAMSKVCNEATARSFQQRSKADIYGLRINNVIEPHEYAKMFPAFVKDPDLRRRNIFAYIDARDLGRMVDCCLKTDGLGYEVFNVANPDASVDLTSDQIAERFYQGVPYKHEMAPDETMYSIGKARRLVGFNPVHSWRDEI